MEDQRQLGRSPGHLNSGRIELPPPRPTRSNPFWLPIYHSPIKENLQKLFIARTMLIATGWYASAEQRHKAGGFVSAMYIQPDNIAQQSERAISLAYIHDVFLRELRRQFGDHECMLDTLCRHLLTQISCTAKATSILATVKLVQPYLAGYGSLSVRGIDIIQAALVLGLGWTCTSIATLAAAQHCRHQTGQLRTIIRTDPSTVGQQEVDDWDSWTWFFLNGMISILY